jgi:hypothetical protein
MEARPPDVMLEHRWVGDLADAMMREMKRRIGEAAP